MHGWRLYRLKGMFNPELSLNNCAYWTGFPKRDAYCAIAAWFSTFCFLQRTCFHPLLMPKRGNSSKARERRARREREREFRDQQDAGYWWGGGMCRQSQTQRWWKFHDLVKTNTCWHWWGLGKQLERAMWVQKLNTLTIICLLPSH